MDFFTAYKNLNSNQTGAVYLLYGREHRLMEQFIEKLKEHTGTTEIARFDYEEDGAESALLELDTISFFLEQRLVVLRNCQVFTSQGKASASAEALEAYLQSPAPGRVLVLMLDADKLDERKKVTKAVKRHVVIECHTPKQAVAIPYLDAFAKSRGWVVEAAALEEVWRRTEMVSQSMMELEKLALYALNRGVTRDDVRQLVQPSVEETVFDWVDHVAQGRVGVAIMMLQSMTRQSYDPLALIAMLVRQFRLMWFAKTLSRKGMSAEEMAKVTKTHPYAMKVAIRQSSSFSVEQLETLLKLAADCEYDIKRGRRDGLQALELVMLTAASGGTRHGQTRAQ